MVGRGEAKIEIDITGHDRRVWAGCGYLRIRISGQFCEHSYEPTRCTISKCQSFVELAFKPKCDSVRNDIILQSREYIKTFTIKVEVNTYCEG